jgi:hypothetical protein
MLRRTSGISSRRIELHAACGELSREYLTVGPHIGDCRDAKAYVLSHSQTFFAQISMLLRTPGFHRGKLNFTPHVANCLENVRMLGRTSTTVARQRRMFYRTSPTSS